MFPDEGDQRSMYNRFHLFLHTRENENAIYISSNRVLIITNESSLGHRVHHVVLGVTLTDLTRPSTLTDTRPPCFEWGKPALRLGASAGTVGFLAGAIWYTTPRRQCQAPASRRAHHPERGAGVPPLGTHGPGGVRSFSPWQVTRFSPYVRRPFPSKETRRIPGKG